MTEFTITVPKVYTFREGWGVTVTTIWDEDTDRVSDVEISLTPIRENAVRVFGTVPCVPACDDSDADAWYPVENYLVDPDEADDDHQDLRSRWFATREEAEEHAESVRRTREHPNPWQPFIKV